MRITERQLRKIIREAIARRRVDELMSFPGDPDYDDPIVTFSRSRPEDTSCARCGAETDPSELTMNRGVCDSCSRTPLEDEDVPQVNIDY